MEKETVLAALREHKTRREASDFAPDSGPVGGGESGGEEAEGQAGAGDQWPLLAGPRPRGSSRRRGTPAGGETAASRKGGRPLSSIATQKLPICLTLPTPPTWGER